MDSSPSARRPDAPNSSRPAPDCATSARPSGNAASTPAGRAHASVATASAGAPWPAPTSTRTRSASAGPLLPERLPPAVPASRPHRRAGAERPARLRPDQPASARGRVSLAQDRARAGRVRAGQAMTQRRLLASYRTMFGQAQPETARPVDGTVRVGCAFAPGRRAGRSRRRGGRSRSTFAIRRRLRHGLQELSAAGARVDGDHAAGDVAGDLVELGRLSAAEIALVWPEVHS